MINTLIIDDEPICIKLLRKQLSDNCKQVKVVETSHSIAEAITKIDKYNPELIFLDVELGSESGFDLFNYYPNPKFRVIFTTAHAKYAVKAIKSSCLEYLLKPIDVKELILSIQKYEKEKQIVVNQKRFEVLLENIQNNNNQINKIAIPGIASFVFLNINDILYCEADLKYTTFYTTKGDKIVSSKNLKEYEDALPSAIFFRCHKSYLVNLNYVRKFHRAESQLQLTNDILIDVSFRKKDEFLKLFEFGKVIK